MKYCTIQILSMYMVRANGDNSIGNDYGVTATPTYFVLDKDKNIIAKPYDFEALKEYMDKHPIKIEAPKEDEKDKKDSENKDEVEKEEADKEKSTKED